MDSDSLTYSLADSLPENKIPVIRVSAQAAVLNPGGSNFTGWIISYADIAGSAPALASASAPAVMSAVDSFKFK